MNPKRSSIRFWLRTTIRSRLLYHELAILTHMETQYQAGENMDLPEDRQKEWWKEIEAQRIRIHRLSMN